LDALYYIVKYNVFDSDIMAGDVVMETLAKMADIEAFNRYMYQTFKPYLGEKTLETGAGTGNITKYLTEATEVTATDVDKNALKHLQNAFGDIYGFSTEYFDLGGEIPSALQGKEFDSVVCLNVLEHVEDDVRALRNMKTLLKKGTGRLILLVPAHQALYSDLDRRLGHYRRYERGQLEQMVRDAGFEIEMFRPFNFMGLFGWFLNGKVLKRASLPSGQLRLYQAMAAVIMNVEKVFGRTIGLSHMVIARA
jgi:SAM-dependent methyltransferase